MHQLDNKVFDIIDARCNHEDHLQISTEHYILQHAYFHIIFNSLEACETERNSMVNICVILSMTKIVKQNVYFSKIKHSNYKK